MKILKQTSLALLSTLIIANQSSVADVLTETQLHATMGIVTNFILDESGITHNGTTYGEVTSPYTGRVWLDRNLGAKRVCTSLDDTECYGDYYQWGRGFDGHQKSSSSDTFTLASDVANVGYGDFIVNATSPSDWTSVDNNGAVRAKNWFVSDGTSVCPTGFRVPTLEELQAELIDLGSAEISNNIDAFNSFLKLPSAGYRYGSSSLLGDVGSRGYVWSVSTGTSTVGNISFNVIGVNVYYQDRSYGQSVRCIEKLQSEEHIHNGTVYGVVTSPYTGRVWLDRNLGAKRVCTSLDDTECYGDYYQWGRGFDGHQESNASDTTILASDVNNVGHGDFITNSTSPFDWVSVDSNGSIRFSNWSATDGSSICPIGFRVPNIVELQAELLDAESAEITNSTDAFNSFLKLPSSGYRGYSSGFFSLQGSWGIVWSNEVNSSDIPMVFFNSSFANWNSVHRTYGHAVRCLRN